MALNINLNFNIRFACKFAAAVLAALAVAGPAQDERSPKPFQPVRGDQDNR